MLGRGLTLFRKALRRPPRSVLARLRREVALQCRRPWDRFRPRRLTERVLLDATGDASVDALWQRLASQPFFVRPTERATYASTFARRFPQGPAEITTAADALLRHEFDLLGSGPTAVGHQLPWHTDFKSGREWPLRWAHDIEPNELHRDSDIKVPWELSRCQHFTTLGQAWWLSGDARYAAEFANEIDDWIARNPYGYGVNWLCPMDVALRALSWIWGFYFFADAPACASAAFRSRFLRTLFLHGELIASTPELDDVNGNHYLCDALGLVWLGLFFDGADVAGRWLAEGRRMVLEEITAQVHPDGTGIEQSTAYHRLVLEAFLAAGLLLRLRGDELDHTFWNRIERMHELVAACVKPDGETPIVGDADDGRIQKLASVGANDFRYLLSTGAVIFARGDFKRGAGRFWEESFWLLGPHAADAFDAIPMASGHLQSQAFADGGVFVLRNPAAHVLVDCGEVGLRGLGGHGHSDILSFELSFDDDSLITDSGSYLYTASRDWRNRFRSTAFHNTVQVDEEEIHRFRHPDELWRLHYDGVPRDVRWEPDREWQMLRAGHRGYERLSPPITHFRTFLLHRQDAWLIVSDRLEGKGTRHLTWRFQLHPSVRAAHHGDTIELTTAGRTAWLTLLSASAPLQVHLEPGWYSPRYGVKVPRTVVVGEARNAVPFACVWTMTRIRLNEQARATALEIARERA